MVQQVQFWKFSVGLQNMKIQNQLTTCKIKAAMLVQDQLVEREQLFTTELPQIGYPMPRPQSHMENSTIILLIYLTSASQLYIPPDFLESK